MTFLRGAADAIRSLATPPPRATPGSAEAAALSGPTTSAIPAPTIRSPWSDGDHLGTVVWSELLGKADWLPLTRVEAMAIPAIARARGIVCTTLGRLPIRAGAVTVVDDVEQFTPAAVQPTVLTQPDPQQARFVQLTWTVDDLIFFGVSWQLVLSRLSTGYPQHLRRIHPGGVEVDDGGVVKVYGQVTDPRNVIRIDGPHEGILEYGSRSLRIARALEASTRRFADNPVPAVELHQTDDFEMTDPEIQALLTAWSAARNGEHGGVAYTPRNIEAKVHGSPAENLLTHGRNAAAVDGARLVGVPADFVDAAPEESSMTYANAETRGRVLIDYGLAAYAAAVEGRLSMPDVLPATQVARWDLSSITRPSAVQGPTPTEQVTP